MNSFEELEDKIIFSDRDWSVIEDDAWIHGIVAGWDFDEGYSEGIFQIFVDRFGWNRKTWEQLKELHCQFEEAKRVYRMVNELSKVKYYNKGE